jgi:predicted metal-dependent peptidase
LARWFSQKAKTDYNMARPNPRYAHTGFFMPSLDNENLGKVAIFWDTSCSVTDSQAADICAETQGLLSHYPGVEVELFHIDTAVRHIEPLDEATNWEDIRPKGRGGTDFRPGFDFLEEDDEEAPIGVIYMTDGECTKFPETPPYPVLWIVVGMGEYERFEPPFGEVAYYTDY